MEGWADSVVVPLTALCEDSNPDAQRAIMHSILNRYELDPVRYGSTGAAVCYKRYQYSEYLPDPGDNADLERNASLGARNEAVVRAIGFYHAIITGQETDFTGGATHFYATSIAPPAWTKGATHCGVWGGTTFWKNVK